MKKKEVATFIYLRRNKPYHLEQFCGNILLVGTDPKVAIKYSTTKIRVTTIPR